MVTALRVGAHRARADNFSNNPRTNAMKTNRCQQYEHASSGRHVGEGEVWGGKGPNERRLNRKYTRRHVPTTLAKRVQCP
eukprot:scaffold83209_cov67-Phaeocystis_antarctica.AAC.1